ncbi:hypothetical protein [Streptomyces sp. NPDC058623]|uniref:hypothetical protein n=1 Tax=Streptomyces sp. NPDC058623 TaxID=3346563 RepID=UPI00365F2D1B
MQELLMRALSVVMPSRQKSWTVVVDDLKLVPGADHWLRNRASGTGYFWRIRVMPLRRTL